MCEGSCRSCSELGSAEGRSEQRDADVSTAAGAVEPAVPENITDKLRINHKF